MPPKNSPATPKASGAADNSPRTPLTPLSGAFRDYGTALETPQVVYPTDIPRGPQQLVSHQVTPQQFTPQNLSVDTPDRLDSDSARKSSLAVTVLSPGNVLSDGRRRSSAFHSARKSSTVLSPSILRTIPDIHLLTPLHMVSDQSDFVGTAKLLEAFFNLSAFNHHVLTHLFNQKAGKKCGADDIHAVMEKNIEAFLRRRTPSELEGDYQSFLRIIPLMQLLYYYGFLSFNGYIPQSLAPEEKLDTMLLDSVAGISARLFAVLNQYYATVLRSREDPKDTLDYLELEQPLDDDIAYRNEIDYFICTQARAYSQGRKDFPVLASLAQEQLFNLERQQGCWLEFTRFLQGKLASQDKLNMDTLEFEVINTIGANISLEALPEGLQEIVANYDIKNGLALAVPLPYIIDTYFKTYKLSSAVYEYLVQAFFIVLDLAAPNSLKLQREPMIESMGMDSQKCKALSEAVHLLYVAANTFVMQQIIHAFSSSAPHSVPLMLMRFYDQDKLYYQGNGEWGVTPPKPKTARRRLDAEIDSNHILHRSDSSREISIVLDDSTRIAFVGRSQSSQGIKGGFHSPDNAPGTSENSRWQHNLSYLRHTSSLPSLDTLATSHSNETEAGASVKISRRLSAEGLLRSITDEAPSSAVSQADLPGLELKQSTKPPSRSASTSSDRRGILPGRLGQDDRRSQSPQVARVVSAPAASGPIASGADKPVVLLAGGVSKAHSPVFRPSRWQRFKAKLTGFFHWIKDNPAKAFITFAGVACAGAGAALTMTGILAPVGFACGMAGVKMISMPTAAVIAVNAAGSAAAGIVAGAAVATVGKSISKAYDLCCKAASQLEELFNAISNILESRINNLRQELQNSKVSNSERDLKSAKEAALTKLKNDLATKQARVDSISSEEQEEIATNSNAASLGPLLIPRNDEAKLKEMQAVLGEAKAILKAASNDAAIRAGFFSKSLKAVRQCQKLADEIKLPREGSISLMR